MGTWGHGDMGNSQFTHSTGKSAVNAFPRPAVNLMHPDKRQEPSGRMGTTRSIISLPQVSFFFIMPDDADHAEEAHTSEFIKQKSILIQFLQIDLDPEYLPGLRRAKRKKKQK